MYIDMNIEGELTLERGLTRVERGREVYGEECAQPNDVELV